MAVQSELTPLTRSPPSAHSLLGTQAHALILASGRQISSATLFPLLHWGNRLVFGALPCGWTALNEVAAQWRLSGRLIVFFG
jgi:hypothetical protein